MTAHPLGVTRPLRHAEALPSMLDGRRRKMGQLRVGLWSPDWSPWAAIARLHRAWPDLSLELQPHLPSAARGETLEQDRRAPAREGVGQKGEARVGARRRG